MLAGIGEGLNGPAGDRNLLDREAGTLQFATQSGDRPPAVEELLLRASRKGRYPESYYPDHHGCQRSLPKSPMLNLVIEFRDCELLKEWQQTGSQTIQPSGLVITVEDSTDEKKVIDILNRERVNYSQPR
jgi:hypothetical protein